MSELIQGFILSGGRSSRMGVPKAELTIGGVSFLERAAGALSALSWGGVSVVGPRVHAELRSIPDVAIESDGLRPPGGALVGLYTAFLAAESDWIAVLACDMPFVTGDLLVKLASVDRTGVDAIVPMDFAGIPQPLCALYHRTPCLTAVEKCFAGGNRSMMGLLSSVKARSVPPSELGPDVSPHSFMNVNTPGDLETAIHLAGPVI